MVNFAHCQLKAFHQVSRLKSESFSNRNKKIPPETKNSVYVRRTIEWLFTWIKKPYGHEWEVNK